MIDHIKNFFTVLVSGSWLDHVENFLIILVSRIAPWAAPLAPAYLVAQAMTDHFDAPLAIGIAVGVTLEAVGVASAHITLEMHNYNTDPARVKDDPNAPLWLGAVATSVYFITGIALTVLLEVWPRTVKIAPALFFVLAGVAYIDLTLISGHARRVKQVAEAKEGRKRTGASTEPAQIEQEPAIVRHLCPQCNRGFGTVQALNAHMRFCDGRDNGTEPEPEREQIDESA
jgi:purine-cytosine permease-like protein